MATVLRLWVEALERRAERRVGQRTAAGPCLRLRAVSPGGGADAVGHETSGWATSGQRTPVEVSGPLPASAVTAAATVEPAKNGLEYRPRGDGTAWAIVRKERRLVLDVNAAAVNHPILAELTPLLNLQPHRLRYEVIVDPAVIPDPLESPSPPSDKVRVSLRSSWQVYFYLANGVEVPDEHLAAGLVRLPDGPDGRPFDGQAITEGLFTVHACRGHEPPPSASWPSSTANTGTTSTSATRRPRRPSPLWSHSAGSTSAASQRVRGPELGDSQDTQWRLPRFEPGRLAASRSNPGGKKTSLAKGSSRIFSGSYACHMPGPAARGPSIR